MKWIVAYIGIEVPAGSIGLPVCVGVCVCVCKDVLVGDGCV